MSKLAPAQRMGAAGPTFDAIVLGRVQEGRDADEKLLGIDVAFAIVVCAEDGDIKRVCRQSGDRRTKECKHLLAHHAVLQVEQREKLLVVDLP
jgi:hypothetical protein